MGPDDASPADMPRRFATPGARSQPLDEDTVERLLDGDLPPDQAPPGYAEVAALLAATVAPPRPYELAGQAAVLAELRAVTRARTFPARAGRTGRRSRRRLGLAVVAVAGALATGGAAAAAGGHLPGPVGDAARSILVSVGGEAPEPPAAPPAVRGTGPGATTAVPSGPGPTGLAGPVPGSPATGSAAVPDTTAADTEGLCRAYLATQDKQAGKKPEAASFELLADEAGGADKVLVYCQDLLQDDARSKEGKQRTPPDDQGQGQVQAPGQGGLPPSTGGSQGQTGPPSTRKSR
jgi:hypothetical protein